MLQKCANEHFFLFLLCRAAGQQSSHLLLDHVRSIFGSFEVGEEFPHKEPYRIYGNQIHIYSSIPLLTILSTILTCYHIFTTFIYSCFPPLVSLLSQTVITFFTHAFYRFLTFYHLYYSCFPLYSLYSLNMLQYHIFTHVFSTFVTFYHVYLLMLSLLFSLLSYHFKTYLYFKFKPLICFKICRLEKTKPQFDVKRSHLKGSSNALMFFCFFKYLDLDPYFENRSGSRRPLNTNPDPKSCYLQVVGFLS